MNPTEEDSKQKLDVEETLPFSPSAFAFSFLKQQVASYISDLVSESVKVSRRHRSDTVSISHIELASANLTYSIRRKFYKVLGMIGGIFFGIGLTMYVDMTISEQLSLKAVSWSLVLGIFGVIMIVIQLTKE